MANHKQKLRVKAAPQDQTQSSAILPGKQKPVVEIDFIRIMLEATLGTFCYLRYIFPDEHFEFMELRKEVLSESVDASTLPSTMIADDSQIPSSQQVTKPLVTRRVVENGTKEAKQFSDRLNGIIEAVGLGHIRSLIMYVILDPDRPNQVLETVTFNFTYGESGPSCILSRDVKDSRGEKKRQSGEVMTSEQVYQAMKVVIKDFVKESQDLPDLPERKCMNFKVFYSDTAPATYQVPGFEAANEEDGLVFGTHTTYEVPAEMQAHTVATVAQGLSVRLASVAGYLLPGTDIESLEGRGPRQSPELMDIYNKHLLDSDRRRVAWDAEASLIDRHGRIAILGMEDEDGVIRPLSASQAGSEDDSDRDYIRVYAKGHGERHTNLRLLHQSEPWGVGDLLIATQQAGQAPSQRSDSHDTISIPSDPETQNKPRSAQVTGSLSQILPIRPAPNDSDSSNHQDGLISSDEHTDPSSQEFVRSKDTFRGASVPPPAPKVKKARSVRAPSTGTAPVARSTLTKRPKAKPKAKPKQDTNKAAPKSRAQKKKADPAPGAKVPAKPKRKAKVVSDGSPTTDSSTANSAAKTSPKKTTAKSKAAAAKQVVEATATSEGTGAGTSSEDDQDVALDCGCGIDRDDPDAGYVKCDGCNTWKHTVCMGVLRPEKLKETFYCAMCRAGDLTSDSDVMLDSQGHFHTLCLLRQILFSARTPEGLDSLPNLCKKLECGVTDVTALLNRLVGEGLLRSERLDKSAPTVFSWLATKQSTAAFSSYFNAGGRKEIAELPGLAGATQLTSSQLPESQSQQFGNSQASMPQVSVAHSLTRHNPTQDSEQQEDIDIDDATPQRLSVSAPNRRDRGRGMGGFSPIPETDPIEEFNSTAGHMHDQDTLDMDVDDPIDDTPRNSSSVSRRFDRSGKRKADHLPLSDRPSARFRSATGMQLIKCPYVEVGGES